MFVTECGLLVRERGKPREVFSQTGINLPSVPLWFPPSSSQSYPTGQKGCKDKLHGILRSHRISEVVVPMN